MGVFSQLLFLATAGFTVLLAIFVTEISDPKHFGISPTSQHLLNKCTNLFGMKNQTALHRFVFTPLFQNTEEDEEQLTAYEKYALDENLRKPIHISFPSFPTLFTNSRINFTVSINREKLLQQISRKMHELPNLGDKTLALKVTHRLKSKDNSAQQNLPRIFKLASKWLKSLQKEFTVEKLFSLNDPMEYVVYEIEHPPIQALTSSIFEMKVSIVLVLKRDEKVEYFAPQMDSIIPPRKRIYKLVSPHQSKDSWNFMKQWLELNGVSLSGIEVKREQSKLHFYPKKNAKTKQSLFEIPYYLGFHLANVGNSNFYHEFSHLFDELDQEKRQDEIVALATALMWCYIRSEECTWSPYIKSMPPVNDFSQLPYLPLYFSDREIKAFYGLSVSKFVQDAKKTLLEQVEELLSKEYFGSLQSNPKYAALFNNSKQVESIAKWALNIVNARNYRYSLKYDVDRYRLLPLIDSLNHSANPNANMVYDAKPYRNQLQVSKNTQKGDELFVSFGKFYSTAELFTRFGWLNSNLIYSTSILVNITTPTFYHLKPPAKEVSKVITTIEKNQQDALKIEEAKVENKTNSVANETTTSIPTPCQTFEEKKKVLEDYVKKATSLLELKYNENVELRVNEENSIQEVLMMLRLKYLTISDLPSLTISRLNAHATEQEDEDEKFNFIINDTNELRAVESLEKIIKNKISLIKRVLNPIANVSPIINRAVDYFKKAETEVCNYILNYLKAYRKTRNLR